MKKTAILLASFSFPALLAYAQPVSTIIEFEKKIKTYPYSDPDPIPQPEGYFYPYFRFDEFSQQGVDQSWKVIELENKYIRVSVFPQIGGKIWGAVEKSTGNEFIYSNSVVKFRDIAMRGPWTSAGIEMNFGIIGHAPTTSSPVAAVRLAELARLWPENLGAGKPYDADERIEDFLEAFGREKKGDKKKAGELFQRVADAVKDKPAFNASGCLTLMALRHLGRSDEFAAYKDLWKNAVPDSPLLNWLGFMVDHRFDDAAQAEKLINTHPGGTPWDPQYADPEFELVKELIQLTTNEL